MKKLLPLFLCAALCLSLCTGFALAAEGLGNFQRTEDYSQGQFSDVAANAWYAANVENTFELALMVGKGSGIFAPLDDVSHAEIVALAARVHSIYHTGAADFTQGEPWYSIYYDYALENRLITSEQYRDYDAPASRYDLVTLMFFTMPISAFGTKNLVDSGAIPDVADTENSVYAFYRAGILSGDENHYFNPWDNVSRAETAAILSRMALPELRLSFTLRAESGIGENDVLGYLRGCYEALETAQTAFILTTFDDVPGVAPDVGANGYMPNYESNFETAVVGVEDVYTMLESILRMTTGNPDMSTANEYMRGAMLHCTDIAAALRQLVFKYDAKLWDATYTDFSDALTYLVGALNETDKVY
jgi:hypothetical protein